MANQNEIQLKIDAILDTKGADVTYKGITKQIKELNSLALQYKDTNVDAFNQVNKAATDIKAGLDDVRDSMRAADGSQLESLNNSVFLLQDGIGNLDFTKASTSLDIMGKTAKGISFKSLTEGAGDFMKSLLNLGKAILANPILLLASVAIAIGAALYKLKDAGGVVTKMFSVLGEALEYVTQLFKDFLDLIGLTDFAGTEKSKNTIANAEKEKTAIEERYNAELALLKATGASSEEVFNKQKKQYADLITANQRIINSLNERKATGIKLNEEQQKQLDEAEKAHRDYVNAVKLLEAERKKAIEDANTAIDKTIEDLRVKRTKSQVDDIQLSAARQKKAILESLASDEKKAEAIALLESQTQSDISKYYAEQSKARADKATADAEKSKNEKIAILNDELKQIQQLRAIDSLQLDLKKQQDVNIVKDGIDLELAYYKNLSEEQLKLLGLTHNDIIQKELELANEKKAIQQDYNSYVEGLQNEADEKYEAYALEFRNNIISENNNELDRLNWLYENKHISTSEYFDKAQALLFDNLEIQRQIEIDNAELTEQQRKDIEAKYADQREQIEKDLQKAKLKAQAEAIQEGVGYARQFVGAITSLNDIITQSEDSKLKQGEEKTVALQKKQFTRKKALGIVNATINTAEAIASALTAGPIVGPILAAVTGALGAAQIAAIAAQRFNPSGGGSLASTGAGSIGGVSTPNVSTSIPAIQSFNTGRTPTPQPPNGGPDMQRVFVTEYDISNTQRKVNVIENRAKFG